MSTEPDIAELYFEFEAALTDVLSEKEYDLERRKRLRRARLRLESHQDFSPTEFAEAVDRAFRSTWAH